MRRLLLLALLALVFVSPVSAAVGGPRTTYLLADIPTNEDGSAVTVLSDNVQANTFIVAASVLTTSSAIDCGIFDGTGVLAAAAVQSGAFATQLSLGPVSVTETAPTTITLRCYGGSEPALIKADTIGIPPDLPRATYLTVFR